MSALAKTDTPMSPQPRRARSQAVAKAEKATLPAVVQPTAPVNMLEVISRAAADPNTDVEKLERLMAMAERTRAKDAEQAFAVAMAEVQNEIKRVAADRENTHTKSSYASYAALDRAIRPIYSKHGFALSFDTGEGALPDHVRVICHVLHNGGHSRDYRADIPCDGKGAQGGSVMTKTHAVGSALSYGSRYLLKLIFNVAIGQDDDDGNGAGDTNAVLTPEMLDELNRMLGMCNGDPELFCKYMKVQAMAEIKQSDMGKAREALNGAINEYQRKNPKKETVS